MPEQHSRSVQQMSPLAVQLEAGLQVLPWQLSEQQSALDAHASPRVLQVLPVGPGGSASQRLPVPQIPQHPLPQASPAFEHSGGWHVPPEQLSEQQSPLFWQSWPGSLQFPSHWFCAEHALSQHWSAVASVHEAPVGKQLGTGAQTRGEVGAQ